MLVFDGHTIINTKTGKSTKVGDRIDTVEEVVGSLKKEVSEFDLDLIYSYIKEVQFGKFTGSIDFTFDDNFLHDFTFVPDVQQFVIPGKSDTMDIHNRVLEGYEYLCHLLDDLDAHSIYAVNYNTTYTLDDCTVNILITPDWESISVIQEII